MANGGCGKAPGGGMVDLGPGFRMREALLSRRRGRDSVVEELGGSAGARRVFSRIMVSRGLSAPCSSQLAVLEQVFRVALFAIIFSFFSCLLFHVVLENN